MAEAASGAPRTLDDLLAREEITDVVKRLARGTDRLDEELIASCYHPDGTDDHNVFQGTGAEFARWVVETLPHFATTMHFVGPPLVRLEGDVAHVDTYCVAHHLGQAEGESSPSDLILGLRYVDRFERRDGRWLIARRVCVFDWTYTVPIDVRRSFVFQEGFVVGARDRTDLAYGLP
jgi:hypothetical protein